MAKFEAVAMDESKNINLPALGDKDKYLIKVRSIWVYDPAERTHLCELTPSYALHLAYVDVVTIDDTPEDIRDELNENMNMDETFTYLHCRDVEKLTERRTFEADDLEGAREYLQGNWIL